jgi:hypothetical protein
MRLPVELIEVIEEIGEPCRRKTPNAIEVALLWVAWQFLNGRNPDEEMMRLEGGYVCCLEKIRAHRQVAELDRLFNLTGATDNRNANKTEGEANV